MIFAGKERNPGEKESSTRDSLNYGNFEN